VIPKRDAAGFRARGPHGVPADSGTTGDVRVDALDMADALPPDIHIVTVSKQPWIVIPSGVPTVLEHCERERYRPTEAPARRRPFLPRIEAHPTSPWAART